MSTLDVVAEVLREVAPRALKARQIAELASGRLPTASKTPATVVSRDLAIDVRDRRGASRFVRVGRGQFVAREAIPTAFYSDSDAYGAAWTRNLVAAGEIAAGVVDERSIRDLGAADVASYRQCHFFGGVGSWSRALRDAGWPDNVNAWSGTCVAARDLWSEWHRLITACRPAWLFGEQVSSEDGLAWLDAVRADLENSDYAIRVLDLPAACAGAPHAEQRLFFAAYARERSGEVLGATWLRGRTPGSATRGGGAVAGNPGPGEQPGAGCACLGAGWMGSVDLAIPVATGAADRSAGAVVGSDSRGVGDTAASSGAGSAIEVVRGATAAPRHGAADGGAAVGGFWAENVEWVGCRPEPGAEGGCLRPAERGARPLDDRAAQGVGRARASRLRALGAAGVRPLAAVFVASVLDALCDATGSDGKTAVTAAWETSAGSMALGEGT